MTDSTFAEFVADNIPVLCWMADADGGVHWYNQAWYDYTGTTPEQMDGWGWCDCHDTAILPEVLKRWTRCLAAKKPFQMVFPLRAADGVYRTFLTRVRPAMRDGKVVSWFGSNTDVSDLIGEDTELKAQLDSLNRRA